jgi:hypothetical protein
MSVRSKEASQDVTYGNREMQCRQKDGDRQTDSVFTLIRAGLPTVKILSQNTVI